MQTSSSYHHFKLTGFSLKICAKILFKEKNNRTASNEIVLTNIIAQQMNCTNVSSLQNGLNNASNVSIDNTPHTVLCFFSFVSINM